MYTCNPKNLYVTDWALDDARNVARMERMLKGMGRPQSDVTVISAEELPDVIHNSGWVGEARQGSYRNAHDPDFMFNAFRWLTPEQCQDIAKSDLFKRCLSAYDNYGECQQWFTGSRTMAMFGAAPFHHYEKRPEWKRGHVCWSLHDLHTAWGCLHRCAYCQRGSVYVINLNVEEFLDHVHELVTKDAPWQKTFRYDVEQDVLAIEPEYGACEPLVDYFARRPDQYLILFSKSANVDHLLPLDHRGHTIMLWTLTTSTVSRRFEAYTGTMEERLEAARKCRDAGYPVRFKCKPVIPTVNWRDDVTQMLEQLYATVTPENISMETVFFDSVSEMDHSIGLDNLDPAFVAAAQEAEKDDAKWSHERNGPKPFTFEVKEEIYRHFIAESKRLSPSTPITLCAETQGMWEALDDMLGCKPWNYPCNCGPHCIPGARSIDSIEGPDADRIAQAAALNAVPNC